MADPLVGENLAGQNLLSICSRGSAIVAELLRLSDHIPPVFYLASKAEQTKYAAILHDFSYLRNIELHENKISSDVDLVDLDEEFRENHLELLERFYRLFESIYKYVKDLNRYIEDVEQGVYIQVRLEDVLASDSGKQLLAEALFLYGLMLTLLDNRIEGPVRERMLVSYYRYKGSSDTHSAVCNLCRATGYLPTSQKRPLKYPEEFFARLPPPLHVVKMVITRLRSDDIYKQMREWPDPSHRSTALASQAAILYVVLFFAPETLHKEPAAMRELVDKHFADNWVLSCYMGFVSIRTACMYVYTGGAGAGVPAGARGVADRLNYYNYDVIGALLLHGLRGRPVGHVGALQGGGGGAAQHHGHGRGAGGARAAGRPSPCTLHPKPYKP